MSVRALLVLSAAALAFSTLPGRAGPCSQDIDRAWLALNAKIQARIGAGRSGPQSITALLHRQPTPASIAAAEELAGDGWAPMEATAAALARAREADHAKDKATCEQALAEAGRAILREMPSGCRGNRRAGKNDGQSPALFFPVLPVGSNVQTREPGSREFWREMERKWLELADSYQHAARTEALLHEMRRFGEP